MRSFTESERSPARYARKYCDNALAHKPPRYAVSADCLSVVASATTFGLAEILSGAANSDDDRYPIAMNDSGNLTCITNPYDLGADPGIVVGRVATVDMNVLAQ